VTPKDEETPAKVKETPAPTESSQHYQPKPNRPVEATPAKTKGHQYEEATPAKTKQHLPRQSNTCQEEVTPAKVKETPAPPQLQPQHHPHPNRK